MGCKAFLLSGLVFALAHSTAAAETLGALERRVKALEDRLARAHLQCVTTVNTSAPLNSANIGATRTMANGQQVPLDYQLVSLGCRVEPWHEGYAPIWLNASTEQCYIKSSPAVRVSAIATFCGVVLR